VKLDNLFVGFIRLCRVIRSAYFLGNKPPSSPAYVRSTVRFSTVFVVLALRLYAAPAHSYCVAAATVQEPAFFAQQTALPLLPAALPCAAAENAFVYFCNGIQKRL
jgi:hypothetical protein